MGGKGEEAKNTVKGNMGLNILKGQAGIASDPRLRDLMLNYSSGKTSLSDALNQASGLNNSGAISAKKAALQKQLYAARVSAAQDHLNNSSMGNNQYAADRFVADSDKVNSLQAELNDLDEQSKADSHLGRSAMHQFFTDPLTGTLVATEQVRSNPLLSGMFGQGGIQDQRQAQETELASRGFSLQPEDHEAYGQASSNVARMFGAQESGLSQALASRGLASGASGAAGAGFSGIQGNKSEQLAQAQMQIAQKRMEMNRLRLADTRAAVDSAGRMAQSAIQDQYGRNRTGVQDYQDLLKNATHAGEIEQGQENKGFEQKLATQGPGLGEILGATLGTAAGVGLGAATGGAGAALGSQLGNGLGQSILAPKKPPTP